MDKIYLNRDNLFQLIKFLDAFKSDAVEVTSDTRSGIGAIVIAKINNVPLNETLVNVEKVISDESDW